MIDTIELKSSSSNALCNDLMSNVTGEYSKAVTTSLAVPLNSDSSTVVKSCQNNKTKLNTFQSFSLPAFLLFKLPASAPTIHHTSWNRSVYACSNLFLCLLVNLARILTMQTSSVSFPRTASCRWSASLSQFGGCNLLEPRPACKPFQRRTALFQYTTEEGIDAWS